MYASLRHKVHESKYMCNCFSQQQKLRRKEFSKLKKVRRSRIPDKHNTNKKAVMGRYLKPHDKDNMKMAMLKQEEVFREQVAELHRLYQVQKLLMREMKSIEFKKQQESFHYPSKIDKWNERNNTSDVYQDYSKPRINLDLERPAEDYTEQESDIELTLATGSRRRKKEDTSDSGASFSSSSTESGVDNLKLQDWRLFHTPEMNMSRPSDRNSGLIAKESIGQDGLKQPSWHLQCLSLNMT